MSRIMNVLFCLFLFTATALTQQPAQRPPMRPIPPAGIEVPAPLRAELEAGLQRLRAVVDKLRDNPLLPDVLIYHEAVRYPTSSLARWNCSRRSIL